MRYPIPDKFAANRVIPKSGGWVMLTRTLPIGNVLNASRMNIFWAINECFTSNPKSKYRIDALATIVTLVTGHPETVCAYDDEISHVSDDNLQLYIDEGGYKPVTFDQLHRKPITKDMEEIRDMIGALQLDGLTETAAINELITCGELSNQYAVLPNWYYQAPEYIINMFNR